MTAATALFDYPQQAAFEKAVPKVKIYAHARPGRRVQQAFTSQVAKIVWQYKLAPETIRLPAAGGVEEVQVFRILLKPGVRDDFSLDVLKSIDKAIGFPIVFELVADEQVRVAAAYKRRSDADAKQWVLGECFCTDWLASDTPRQSMPVAVDLAGLYRGLLQPLMPHPPRVGESLREHAKRVTRIAALNRDLDKLRTKLDREKQFNRKVEVNGELRAIQTQLDELTTESNEATEQATT